MSLSTKWSSSCRVQGSCPTETYAATLLAPPRASRARSVNALHTELCPCPL